MTACAPIDELRVRRPRDRFLRWSGVVFVAILLGSIVFGGFDLGELFTAQRAANLERFAVEVRPEPLQNRDPDTGQLLLDEQPPWDWAVAFEWASDQFVEVGFEAAVATLAIAILAIVLAASVGALLALASARTLATPEPYLPRGREPSRWVRAWWWCVRAGTRLVLVLLRSLPEYLIAFLFLAMLGPTAWPAVLALAIHNAGILGRLYSETIENLPPSVPSAMRGLGATRSQIAAFALWPAGLGRGLLYAFYRWETCIREATVLGMLGVISLGYWISDARNRDQHDVFVFLIGLGVVLVLLGDLVSALVRRVLR